VVANIAATDMSSPAFAINPDAPFFENARISAADAPIHSGAGCHSTSFRGDGTLGVLMRSSPTATFRS
jgi:hypothetical protein